MDGLLIIDKPEGLTSAEVVRRIKRVTGEKVGHLGTLDPFATGVLPVCLGEATKIAQFLSGADKGYVGTIRLGRATDSGDRTGRMTEERPVPRIEATDLRVAEKRFHGEQMQVPPMYSAIKRCGTPLYKLARRGIEVGREPRPVRIDTLRLELEAADVLHLTVECSKGTYVRVLAEEIAAALGTVGYLDSLRRTRFGRCVIAEAIPLDEVGTRALPIVTMRKALAHLEEISIDSETASRARQGFTPILQDLPRGQGQIAMLVDPDGLLVAVVGRQEGHPWRYLRVFSASEKVA